MIFYRRLANAIRFAYRAFRWSWRMGRRSQRRELASAVDYTSDRFTGQPPENPEQQEEK